MKDRTVCKSCYNKNRRENNNNTLIQNQRPKNDEVKNDETNNPKVSTYENHDNVVIGQRNIGKTFYMLKMLVQIGNKRPNHITTRSSNQYPNYKTNHEIEPIKIDKKSVLIFDDMLGARNNSQTDDFYTRGKMKI